MHEVDGGVRLEKIAPGALARMRLARDEQYAETVANAFDDGDGAVVLLGDLAGQGIGDDLGDVLATMIDQDRQRHALPRLNLDIVLLAIVRANGDANRPWRIAGLLDPKANDLLLADDAEARRLLDDDAPVDLLAAAGDEAMQRGVDAKPGHVARHVMDLSVSDEDGAGEALRRHFRESLV